MEKKKLLRLRYNTENKGTQFWRLIQEDESELLADDVKIQVPTFTSMDQMKSGQIKGHLSCYYDKLSYDLKQGKLTVTVN